jgi:hypothetical protein
VNTAFPPRWAESLLRLLLAPEDRQSVSGDLLEEYRENVHPARGRRRADLWYVSQVAGFAWRAHRTWAALLGGAFVSRTAIDWLWPTTDFYARSTVSTFVAAGIFVCAGGLAAWRTRSFAAGALAGAATAIVGAAISTVGDTLLLAIWHDAGIFEAIEGSGGLDEVYVLPLFLVVPGTILGILGGLVGGVMRRIVSPAR